MRRILSLVVLAFVSLLPVSSNLAAETKTVERLAPVYRHSMLVSDLERSLTLYRDILGMTLSRVSDTSSDSYSYAFFNIKPGAMKRFAYLNGEGGQREVLGLAEVPSFSPSDPDGPRAVAWVQTVADVEGALSEAAKLGLEVVPPIEFMSREAGKPGVEGGIIDFDGHLILIYGLTRESMGLPPVKP